ncbi:class I SAM-dependent methyltransferase [bacterium]|nr:class I SAM-dependent methyltransferase [bacterium]
MNQHSESSTIDYYDKLAAEYIATTAALDMSELYEPFLNRLPKKGDILDAGCGSGRDSKAFMNRGFHVTSIDASSKMVEATTLLTGQEAMQVTFQTLSLTENFDGIWACASLLHVPMKQLPNVLKRLAKALRPSGTIYASFKEGCEERVLDGRLFNDLNESRFRSLVDPIEELRIAKTWLTDDLRAERRETWFNVLLIRK